MENDEFFLNPQDYLNFHGKDWNIIRGYLKHRQEQVMESLCREMTQDETNVARGTLRAYRDLLSLEQAAPRAAQQE